MGKEPQEDSGAKAPGKGLPVLVGKTFVDGGMGPEEGGVWEGEPPPPQLPFPPGEGSAGTQRSAGILGGLQATPGGWKPSKGERAELEPSPEEKRFVPAACKRKVRRCPCLYDEGPNIILILALNTHFLINGFLL